LVKIIKIYNIFIIRLLFDYNNNNNNDNTNNNATNNVSDNINDGNCDDGNI